jgi:hypothetical protein
MDQDQQNSKMIEIFADIGVKLHGLNQHLKEEANWRRKAHLAAQPVQTHIPFTATVPASGFIVIGNDTFGPVQGFIWNIRSIAIGGANDPDTVIAGRADIYVSAADYRFATASESVGLQDWRDQSLTLPNIAFYSRGALTCRLNENLWIAIDGGTPGQIISGGIQVEQFQESATTQTWDM